MAALMVGRGGVAALCSLLVAALARGVMGQPPPSPPDSPVPPSPSWNWDVPPGWDGTPPSVTDEVSSQNGRIVPANYNKPNRIFICEANDGGTCVAQCPDECPMSCQVMCDECATWCGCPIGPRATCGDPSFTGGDCVTFYFHGKRDQDFCIVSNADLHINAHFIGNYNPSNERTFTWIHAIGIAFGDHRIYLGARKADKWDEEEDHIQITFDDEPANIDTTNKARWVSKVLPGLSVRRTSIVNSVVVELPSVFKITASAVPITDEDSKIHNYGRTTKDSLVHLDIRFKFYSLTDLVDSVLGQTYRSDYVNKMNVTAKMPIMGGTPKYLSSGLFSMDCAVSKFRHGKGASHVQALAA